MGTFDPYTDPLRWRTMGLPSGLDRSVPPVLDALLMTPIVSSNVIAFLEDKTIS